MKIEIEKLPDGRLRVKILEEEKAKLAWKGRISKKKNTRRGEIWYIK